MPRTQRAQDSFGMTRAADLPTGVVTFVFSDIEGSTAAVAAMGDEAFADALASHRTILRQAFEQEGGHAIALEGDAFFVVFKDAHHAVDAASNGQQALERNTLRVRIGIHTGEAVLRDGEYIGHEVHRAKRICDVGHGGQILLSQATADAIGSNVKLVDLGSHHLKDLEAAERIFQAGDKNFPALRSLESFARNLPLQRSEFIGREREIVQVNRHLDTQRLVTFTGIGGSGKTRLALEVAERRLDRYPGGVFFVDLAPVTDPSVVMAAVAAALNLAPSASPGGTPEQLVQQYLAGRTSLIILDNCEHVRDASADAIDRILAGCPGVSVLATSREPLRVDGEQLYPVPSLSLPDGNSDGTDSEAVELFAARARAVRPSFELTTDNIGAVIEICRRLDGIPLAIEFGAARMSHLTAQQVNERLDDMFRLLEGGRRRVKRQQTLRAAIDWSYDLLEADEQVLFARLAPFVGGFDLAAAESVCTDASLERSAVFPLVASLVSKSLVQVDDIHGEARYRLLESVRQYAVEKLRESGDEPAVRERHSDWYLTLFGTTPTKQAWLDIEYYERAEMEIGNLRASLRWADEHGNDVSFARTTGALGSFLFNTGKFEEAERWARRALERTDELDRNDHVACLVLLGWCASVKGDPAAASLLNRAIEVAEGVPYHAMLVALVGLGYTQGLMLAVELYTGAVSDDARERRFEDVRGTFRYCESLMDGDPEAFSMFYPYWSDVELLMGDVDAAVRYGELSIEGARRAIYGLSRASGVVATCQGRLAVARHLAGDVEGALQAANDAIGASSRREGEGVSFGARWIDHDAAPIGAILAFAAAGQIDRARELAHEQVLAYASQPAPLAVNSALLTSAVVSYLAGEAARACRLLGAAAHTGAAALAPAPFDRGESFALYSHYAPLVAQALDPDEAKRYASEGRAMPVDEAVKCALEV